MMKGAYSKCGSHGELTLINLGLLLPNWRFCEWLISSYSRGSFGHYILIRTFRHLIRIFETSSPWNSRRRHVLIIIMPHKIDLLFSGFENRVRRLNEPLFSFKRVALFQIEWISLITLRCLLRLLDDLIFVLPQINMHGVFVDLV